MERSSLNSRLRNCLLTILELEETLTLTHLGPALREEFTTLKQVVQRLEDVQIEESDVCRIEAATSRFLAELKETLEGVESPDFSTTRLLQ